MVGCFSQWLDDFPRIGVLSSYKWLASNRMVGQTTLNFLLLSLGLFKNCGWPGMVGCFTFAKVFKCIQALWLIRRSYNLLRIVCIYELLDIMTVK